MALQKATVPGTDEKKDVVRLFKSVLRNTIGTIDFDAVARGIDAANGEAARKRFKRAFEKEPDIGPLNMVGSNLLGSAAAHEASLSTTPKTPKKLKTPVTPATSDGDGSPGVKASSKKKRKVDVIDDEKSKPSSAKKTNTIQAKGGKGTVAVTDNLIDTPRGQAEAGYAVREDEDLIGKEGSGTQEAVSHAVEETGSGKD